MTLSMRPSLLLAFALVLCSTASVSAQFAAPPPQVGESFPVRRLPVVASTPVPAHGARFTAPRDGFFNGRATYRNGQGLTDAGVIGYRDGAVEVVDLDGRLQRVFDHVCDFGGATRSVVLIVQKCPKNGGDDVTSVAVRLSDKHVLWSQTSGGNGPVADGIAMLPLDVGWAGLDIDTGGRRWIVNPSCPI